MLVAGASIFIIITIFMKVISSSEIHLRLVVFWDVILCSLIKVHKYIRESCCLHPTCPDNRGSRTSEMAVLCTRLLGIISQMTAFSLVTSVRQWEPQISLKTCLCCGLLCWDTMSFCVSDNYFGGILPLASVSILVKEQHLLYSWKDHAFIEILHSRRGVEFAK